MEETVLGIDFGTRRIGLALSHASLAVPLQVLPHTDAVLDKLLAVLAEHRVARIVVGISEGDMAEQTRAFVHDLQQVTDLPIEFMDETLSSHTVHQKLREVRRTKRGEPIDHFAAAEFLQEWLDQQ